MLIESARDDERVATALHEAGHARAYISRRLNFRYITMNPRDGDALAMLQPYRRPISPWDKAVTAMAGPAVEALMFHHGNGGDADVMKFILGGHREAIEFAEWEPDSHNDYTSAGPLALTALPGLLAMVTASWADIERIAAAVLASSRAVTYPQVMGLIEDPYGFSIATELARWQGCHDLITKAKG